MKRAQRRELRSRGKKSYISITIPLMPSETRLLQSKKVFEACTDALEELAGLVRVIVNDMQGTDIFDHGRPRLPVYLPPFDGRGQSGPGGRDWHNL